MHTWQHTLLLKEARKKMYKAREKYKDAKDVELTKYRKEVCMCVCEKERERKREREIGVGGSFHLGHALYNFLIRW